MPKQTEQAPDAELLESLGSAHFGITETYTSLYLPDEREEAALTDLAAGISPDMSARHLDYQALQEQGDALKNWKKELLQISDIDPDLRQAYRWRINEDIANIHMLEASAAGDTRNFRRWNEFIYGEPDETVYKAALDWVAHDAETLVEHEASSVREAASEVLRRIGDNRGSRELLMPDEGVFELVQEDHMREKGFYALLLAGVELPEKGKVPNEIGDPVLRHVVANNLESDYSVEDGSGATWSVSHSAQSIKRPGKYNMPVRRFTGLALGHEVGSHLLERINGSRGPVALMQRGLDRYDQGNEGRAVVREQVVYDTFDAFGKIMRWQDILARHIAISYAWGAGGKEPKPAAEVYDFMYAINKMYQAKRTPDDPELIDQKTARKTGKLCTRVLKGTDGTGGAYLKDKIYLEGHVAVWRAAAEHGAGVISHGDLGKFDITNPRHIALLQKQGLLPE